MDLDFLVSAHKNAKKERGQYPAILTSRLVNITHICIVSDSGFVPEQGQEQGASTTLGESSVKCLMFQLFHQFFKAAGISEK